MTSRTPPERRADRLGNIHHPLANPARSRALGDTLKLWKKENQWERVVARGSGGVIHLPVTTREARQRAVYLKWHADHAEAKREYCRQWYQRNKARVAAQQREYRRRRALAAGRAGNATGVI